MACLFAVFAGAFPRVAAVLLWRARPTLFTAPFGGAGLWPRLGILFVPLTTRFSVVRWLPTGGLAGFDRVWLALAVALDRSPFAGSASANRDRGRGYAPTGAPTGTR